MTTARCCNIAESERSAHKNTACTSTHDIKQVDQTMRFSAQVLLLCSIFSLLSTIHGSKIRRGALKLKQENEITSPVEYDKALNANRQLYTIVVVSTPGISYDMGIRFSKVRFDDASIDTSRLPLSRADYPVTMETANWLSESRCPSVVVPEQCPECEGYDFETLVSEIGGPPTNPGEAGYWEELYEVALVQELRKNNTDANSVLPLPDIWEGFDLADVANAVHDEYPGSHHQSLIQYLLKDGATVDNNSVPQHCNAEFLRGIVMLSHLNTWAIATVGPINFAVKYFVGRARPEEVAYKIYTGELTLSDGVPQDLLDIILDLNLTKAEEFTAYPEGSPMHPSWPAMHSAASVGSTWLAVVMNLSEEQKCQAKLVDYGVAYARTVAAVHYASDNMAGLKLGQKIMENVLPGYLEEKYGANATLVQNKIKAVHFEWDDFLESDCYKTLMT